VAVMRRDPVAPELRGDGEDDLVAGAAQQRQRAQPVFEGGVAVFALEVRAHAHPGALQGVGTLPAVPIARKIAIAASAIAVAVESHAPPLLARPLPRLAPSVCPAAFARRRSRSRSCLAPPALSKPPASPDATDSRRLSSPRRCPGVPPRRARLRSRPPRCSKAHIPPRSSRWQPSANARRCGR